MKAALVTGGAKRLGAAMVRALAADGWAVAIHYGASADAATALAAEVGQGAKEVAADLADGAAVEGLIAAAADALGHPLSLLINNASLFEEDWADNIEAAHWDRHMAVNLRAPTILSSKFARQMPEGDAGLIVNILDQKLWGLNPDFFSYTISKIGLRGATEMMAMALAPRVRVCGIAPGITLPSKHQSDEHFQKVRALNPLQQGVETGDIVRTLRFLIDSPAITGETILVDAGQHLERQARDVAYVEDDKI